MRLPASLLILVAACDVAKSADLDPEETIDRLGAAGYAKLCSEFEDYVRETYRSNRLIQLACTAEAMQTTPDAVACGEAVDACLDTLPPAVETQLQRILDQAGCGSVAIEPAGCTSKVSQLQGCLDALGDQLDTIQLELTCAAFGSPVPPDWWRIDVPAACASLAQSC